MCTLFLVFDMAATLAPERSGKTQEAADAGCAVTKAFHQPAVNVIRMRGGLGAGSLTLLPAPIRRARRRYGDADVKR